MYIITIIQNIKYRRLPRSIYLINISRFINRFNYLLQNNITIATRTGRISCTPDCTARTGV